MLTSRFKKKKKSHQGISNFSLEEILMEQALL